MARIWLLAALITVAITLVATIAIDHSDHSWLQDPWLGREVSCFFPTRSVSVVINPAGIGRLHPGDTCEMGNEWHERVVYRLEPHYYIAVITANPGGECPPGTALIARDSGLEMLSARYANKAQEIAMERRHDTRVHEATAAILKNPTLIAVPEPETTKGASSR